MLTRLADTVLTNQGITAGASAAKLYGVTACFNKCNPATVLASEGGLLVYPKRPSGTRISTFL